MQNFVVVFGDCFDQLGVEGFGFLLQFGGNLAGNVLGAQWCRLPR